MDRVALHYQDDGPSGPCGQTMSVTSPWSRIYIYEGPTAEVDADAFRSYLQVNQIGRRNARVTAMWCEADGPSFEGPLVPAGQRVGLAAQRVAVQPPEAAMQAAVCQDDDLLRDLQDDEVRVEPHGFG